MRKFYDGLRRFCAFIVGAVFFISGLLKLMDPVGAGLVVDEYLKFMHAGFLSFASEFTAVALAFAETFTGLALLTGVWRRLFAAVSLAFLAFFTVLTAVLAALNPQMDCGCFGEAVHLTHFQSLAKNIILCILAAIAFFPFGKLGLPKKRKYVSFSLVAVSVIAFAVYPMLYIPAADFTDFKAGARLESSADGPSRTYSASFIYEKDGVLERFGLENLPDSSWTFVRTETETAATHGETIIQLPVSDASGEHFDELAASGNVIAVSVLRPYSLSAKKWHSVASLVAQAHETGFVPLVLVPENPDEAAEWLYGHIAAEDAAAIAGAMYFSDYKTLVTMNRSNGGATCFRDGCLIRKWAFRNLPDLSEIRMANSANAAELAASYSSRGHLMLQAYLLYVFSVILFL